MTKAAKIDKSTAIDFVAPGETPSAPENETPSAALPPSDDNLSFETYREKAREHGRSRAIGDDSIAMLAIDIADGAKHGKIDPRTTTDKTKDNADDTTDNIETLFVDYVHARGLKAIHERKGNSVKNKVTQLRKFAHLGKLKDVDGPSVLADVVARYKVTYEKATEAEQDMLNDAFTVYYNAAMEQVKFPKAALTDDQIEKCLRKPTKTVTKTIASEWSKIAKAVKSLTDGTKTLSDGTVIEDKSPEGQNLALQIAEYAKAKEDELALAEADKAAADLRAKMLARNGAAAQENIPA